MIGVSSSELDEFTEPSSLREPTSCANRPTPKRKEQRRQDASQCIREALELCKRGRFRQAIQTYNLAHGLDPSDPDTLHSRGRVHYNLGNLTKAKDDMTAAIRMMQQQSCAATALAEVHNDVGLVHFDLHDYASAKSSAERAIELDPLSSDACALLAQVHLAHDELSLALARTTRALQLAGQNAPVYATRGHILLRSGDREGALRDFTHAVQLDPQLAHAYTGLGQVAFLRGQDKAAVLYFTKSISLDQYSAIPYRLRADIRRIQKQFSPAIADYRASLALDPSNSSARRYLGLCLYRQNQPREALEQLDRALALGDQYVMTLHAAIGRCLVRLGHYNAAVGPLRIASDLEHFQRRAAGESTEPGQSAGVPNTPDEVELECLSVQQRLAIAKAKQRQSGQPNKKSSPPTSASAHGRLDPFGRVVKLTEWQPSSGRLAELYRGRHLPAVITSPMPGALVDLLEKTINDALQSDEDVLNVANDALNAMRSVFAPVLARLGTSSADSTQSELANGLSSQDRRLSGGQWAQAGAGTRRSFSDLASLGKSVKSIASAAVSATSSMLSRFRQEDDLVNSILDGLVNSNSTAAWTRKEVAVRRLALLVEYFNRTAVLMYAAYECTTYLISGIIEWIKSGKAAKWQEKINATSLDAKHDAQVQELRDSLASALTTPLMDLPSPILPTLAAKLGFIIVAPETPSSDACLEEQSCTAHDLYSTQREPCWPLNGAGVTLTLQHSPMNNRVSMVSMFETACLGSSAVEQAATLPVTKAREEHAVKGSFNANASANERANPETNPFLGIMRALCQIADAVPLAPIQQAVVAVLSILENRNLLPVDNDQFFRQAQIEAVRKDSEIEAARKDSEIEAARERAEKARRAFKRAEQLSVYSVADASDGESLSSGDSSDFSLKRSAPGRKALTKSRSHQSLDNIMATTSFGSNDHESVAAPTCRRNRKNSRNRHSLLRSQLMTEEWWETTCDVLQTALQRLPSGANAEIFLRRLLLDMSLCRHSMLVEGATKASEAAAERSERRRSGRSSSVESVALSWSASSGVSEASSGSSVEGGKQANRLSMGSWSDLTSVSGVVTSDSGASSWVERIDSELQNNANVSETLHCAFGMADNRAPFSEIGALLHLNSVRGGSEELAFMSHMAASDTISALKAILTMACESQDAAAPQGLGILTLGGTTTDESSTDSLPRSSSGVGNSSSSSSPSGSSPSSEFQSGICASIARRNCKAARAVGASIDVTHLVVPETIGKSSKRRPRASSMGEVAARRRRVEKLDAFDVSPAVQLMVQTCEQLESAHLRASAQPPPSEGLPGSASEPARGIEPLLQSADAGDSAALATAPATIQRKSSKTKFSSIRNRLLRAFDDDSDDTSTSASTISDDLSEASSEVSLPSSAEASPSPARIKQKGSFRSKFMPKSRATAIAQ
ncbi:hypothetical protein CAOG_01436 [Capsaspora owczarzaki ATCC 30864]|uniref:Uncharacterized protein n=1 Tax=Capsaspora owczarzaki (strain ATCC 30864) TaxID=595528 RepID=A0A0D2U4I3_CAPO3|nr:hypothetical protein CAOG_01436 [Capsaspora owczarzaki ATCC 30864]KJE90061.1 hypothetical protein CAOG_001436 [Capsaspora owczarzaki ATCC 30864]|eukprot:XP_004364304.1 hypothetical protein CAOG_01436 [Capsaspora owczarzaki ATCC 30864]